MDRTLVAGRARHLQGLQNQLPDSLWCHGNKHQSGATDLPQQRRPIEPRGVMDIE